MKTFAVAIGILVLGLRSAPLATAGNNASASATLSWDRAGTVTSLMAAPGAHFPFFVHLENAPDIRALAIWIKWTPYDSAGSFYDLVRDPAEAFQSLQGDSTCGYGHFASP